MLIFCGYLAYIISLIAAIMATIPVLQVGGTKYSQGLTSICWIDPEPVAARFVGYRSFLLSQFQILFYIWQWILITVLVALYGCAIYVGIRNFKVSSFLYS